MTQLRTLLKRAFISKLRNRGNLVITIGVAPVLAFLIASLLRYSDSGTYDFAPPITFQRSLSYSYRRDGSSG